MGAVLGLLFFALSAVHFSEMFQGRSWVHSLGAFGGGFMFVAIGLVFLRMFRPPNRWGGVRACEGWWTGSSAR